MSTTELSFPPLLWGEEVTTDALEHACMRAAAGCDAGLVAWRAAPDVVQGALVFAPEVPLQQAMAMLPVCGVGFQNALGVLAPPEVSVHLDWSGGILVNGAACGRFRGNAPGATVHHGVGSVHVAPPVRNLTSESGTMPQQWQRRAATI